MFWPTQELHNLVAFAQDTADAEMKQLREAVPEEDDCFPGHTALLTVEQMVARLKADVHALHPCIQRIDEIEKRVEYEASVADWV